MASEVTGTNEPDTTATVPGASSSAGAISVRNLTKEFDTEEGIETVFDDVSFDIEPGSFVTLIGRSGSGKSTMLNIISGVLEPTAGSVEFETNAADEEVTLGHVFQSPRLLPWNTCVENIEYVHEANPDYTQAHAEKYLDLVGLSEHYDKYPSQLSGGQRQRVGITRALSIDPEVLIMDEPFSNLDEITAEQLRDELIDIWQKLGKTVFFVTHDITEAIELSDRILMLGDGRIFDDMSIDLERPRDVDSEEFLKVRQDAIERFHAIA
jgi:NitT/TauT family transport system ATP-binding protein